MKTEPIKNKFKEYDENFIKFINNKSNDLDYIHYNLLLSIARNIYENRTK